jgi:hypothetical protein
VNHSPTPIVIGLTGAAGAGKDTVADRLAAAATAVGHSALRVSFADPIRAMLSAMGVPAAYMHDRALKELPVPGIGRSYRQLAQTLGTEWGRSHVNRAVWLTLAARRIDDEARAVSPNQVIAIISDVRFPDEAAWLRRRNGLLVRIDRPGLAPVARHASETYHAFIAPDVDLHNASTLAHLHDRADQLAPGLFFLAHQRIAAAQCAHQSEASL